MDHPTVRPWPRRAKQKRKMYKRDHLRRIQEETVRRRQAERQAEEAIRALDEYEKKMGEMTRGTSGQAPREVQ